MKPKIEKPYAITMWDFSWLERRWPGAGYEDWDEALDELKERGYNAVRIDAFPHLVSAGPDKLWDILPAWNQTSWGAQSLTRVRVLPALIEFIAKCRDRGIGVGLSTWYRQDPDDVRLRIKTPADQAKIWLDTLAHIDRAGLLDALLYVDFCNEFPIPFWTPYLYGGVEGEEIPRKSPRLVAWMRESIELARKTYPDLNYTYSFCTQYRDWAEQDVTMLDILEPHIWMSHPSTSDWNEVVGYHFQKFSPEGFDNIVKRGFETYRDSKAKYDGALTGEIDNVAAWSRESGKPLVTTECWSVVDYKDWPLLDWGWIKDLCELGVTHAAITGRWIGMGTSNFCGPQFVGMWRDVDWHQRLTKLIKSSPIDADLRS
jgi:sugar phosphate isomerase/epimerase